MVKQPVRVKRGPIIVAAVRVGEDDVVNLTNLMQQFGDRSRCHESFLNKHGRYLPDMYALRESYVSDVMTILTADGSDHGFPSPAGAKSNVPTSTPPGPAVVE